MLSRKEDCDLQVTEMVYTHFSLPRETTRKGPVLCDLLLHPPDYPHRSGWTRSPASGLNGTPTWLHQPYGGPGIADLQQTQNAYVWCSASPVGYEQILASRHWALWQHWRGPLFPRIQHTVPGFQTQSQCIFHWTKIIPIHMDLGESTDFHLKLEPSLKLVWGEGDGKGRGQWLG